MFRRLTGFMLCLLMGLGFVQTTTSQGAEDARVSLLAKEVGEKGWIAYSARSENGSWDLFLSRPDGSQCRNLTNTKDFEEAAPRFSLDGKKMLFRRLEKGAVIDHDRWGFQGRLVIAGPDASNPVVFGEEGEYSWASWSPDAREVVCLDKKGIEIIDLETKEVVRKLPRKGIYQQLFWSPDGKWFCGTANHQGISWTVVRMNAETGEVNPLRAFQNCTADWFPDSNQVIVSSRPAGQTGNDGYGYTQLWMVDGDGQNSRLIYGEDGYHMYGGALSPDGRYVLFTKGLEDGSGAEKSGAPICIMRLEDAPSIGGESAELRKLHPETKDGPVLVLPDGWEPCWTYAEIGGSQ